MSYSYNCIIKMKFFKYSLLVLVCCLKAQTTSSINGFVRDDATGEPISYANVFLANTSLGAATNQDGYFVITKVPLGPYEINASMIGYGIYNEEIMLFEGMPIRLDIRLKEEVIQTASDLKSANVDVITAGQYLQPSLNHLPVVEYVHPEKFASYQKIFEEMGFLHVVVGPFVRSSFQAADFIEKIKSVKRS